MFRKRELTLPELEKSVRRLRVIAIVLATTALASVLLTTGLSLNAWDMMSEPGLSEPVFGRSEDGGLLYMTGDITAAGAEKLEQMLAAEEPRQTQVLMLQSRGGNAYAAGAIAQSLNKRGIGLHIALQCGSSCVGVFAETQKKAALPLAWFFFHQGSYTRPRFEWLARATDQMVEPPSTSMDPWVEAISPKLLRFFQGCEQDPLRTDAGIHIRWDEIEDVVAGAETFRCDDIVARNRHNIAKEFSPSSK